MPFWKNRNSRRHHRLHDHTLPRDHSDHYLYHHPDPPHHSHLPHRFQSIRPNPHHHHHPNLPFSSAKSVSPHRRSSSTSSVSSSHSQRRFHRPSSPHSHPHHHNHKFRSRDFDRDRWWRDWPSDWPRMDAVVPRFHSHLDRFDRNWRDDPFWRDLYPRWAEPIFKEGIDVKTNVVNDSRRFAVDIDTYQFRPEELQVKTMDDTLLIEGRHEDVRDRDNYTKMNFVRKYQLPSDVEPGSISSHIDNSGRLTVEAQKRLPAIEGERAIPIESGSRFGGGFGSRASSYSPRDRYPDSGRGSANDYYRTDSRLNGHGGGEFLSPKPRSDGYKTEYESRQADANGMRHEARRQEHREEFRRGGSTADLLPPPASPLFRTESRLSGAAASGGEDRRESQSHHFRRTASASSREFRSGGFSNGGGEHLLRPSVELGGRSSAFGTRNVPIHRG